MSITAAKILEQRSHLVSGKLRITEHFFQVPRDYSRPAAGNLTLFARSAEKHERPADPTDSSSDASKKRLPWLLFLQGGPGFGCRPPQQSPWTMPLLARGYKLLCLDQRGTGLSTPLTAGTLGLRGDDEVQAEYMRSFRADNIVRDCEAVRLALTEDWPEERKKWSVMGQSFGGFCCTTYLSFFPESLREVFLFGGLPPLVDHPDKVYRKLIPRMITRTNAYYEKYPEDVDRVKKIVSLLRKFGDNTVRLPSEGSLSARRFLQLGVSFGFHGGIDSVHQLVLRAATDLTQFGSLTRPTLSSIDSALPFDDHIIYAALHEPIYCQGDCAPDWSAERVLQEIPQFSLDTDGPLQFTGETIFPFMFEDYAELRKLAGPAHLLAKHNSWSTLYDEDQLAKNTVPVYAAVYMDDAYVDFDLSLETARKIKGCKVFVSNMLYHDAIRSRMDESLRGVFSLRDDVID